MISLEFFEKMGTLSVCGGLLLKHFKYGDLRSDNWLFSAYMFFLLWWIIWPVLGSVEAYERYRKYRLSLLPQRPYIDDREAHLFIEQQRMIEAKGAVA